MFTKYKITGGFFKVHWQYGNSDLYDVSCTFTLEKVVLFPTVLPPEANPCTAQLVFTDNSTTKQDVPFPAD